MPIKIKDVPSSLKLYRRFRSIGYRAERALSSARTVERFIAFADDLVRLRMDYEQESYFDVYGEPDTARERENIVRYLELWGCYSVYTEFLDENGEWQLADSVGMCVYEHPLCPFDNEYVVDLMQSALDQMDDLETQAIDCGAICRT